MQFTEALSRAQAEFTKGPRCSVAVLLDGNPEADQINAAITNEAIPGTLIARALNESGAKVRPEAVQRHRRGACGCDRT